MTPNTHENRVAERDPMLCTAYGCPLMGVMTGSTSGSDSWSCALHANKPASELQPITAAINRYRWLAEAITNIRGLVPGRPDKGKVLERIQHDFEANGRPDLFWNGAETVRQWVNRLEPEFDKLVLAEITLPPNQQTIKTDTWGQAGNRLPQWA